jgi:hypothetical protein
MFNCRKTPMVPPQGRDFDEFNLPALYRFNVEQNRLHKNGYPYPPNW